MNFLPIHSLSPIGHIEMAPIAFRFPSWRYPLAFPITSQYADLDGQNVPEMCEMRSDYPLVFRCVGLWVRMRGSWAPVFRRSLTRGLVKQLKEDCRF